MASIDIGIDYYRLSYTFTHQRETLVELLGQKESVGEIIRGSSHVVASTLHIRLTALSSHQLGGVRIYAGDLETIDMSLTKHKSHVDGGSHAIELSTREGIGDFTAFLFAPSIDLLVIQRNLVGVTPRRFCGFWQRHTKAGKIDYAPIMTVDALDRYERIKQYCALDVSVSGDVNPEEFQDDAVRSLLKAHKAIGSKYFSLRLSLGPNHHKNRLSSDRTPRFIRAFLDAYAEGKAEVKKMEVTGYDEDESGAQRHVVDLINERAKDKRGVRITDERILAYSDRRQVLIDSYMDNRERYNLTVA